MKPSTFTIFVCVFVGSLAARGVGGAGGGGDNRVVPQQTANVTGTWNALMTVTSSSQAPRGFQFTATLTLAQSGTTVSGTFATARGLSGQINGASPGETMTFTIAQRQPCPGNFGGVGAVSASGTQLNGSYSGSDCNGSLAASFVGRRR